MRKATLALAIAAGLTLSSGAHAARFVINNVDPPGRGFNDATPAAPVGGNTGTSIGEQRRIAFAYALQIWGNSIESSVPITLQGSFQPLTCSATGAVLGSAGTQQIFSDFRGAPLAGHWYHGALANTISGRDLSPGPNDAFYRAPTARDEIRAQFNSELGKPGCLPGAFFYYGLDNNAPAGQIDFLNTFLHEVAHGLGFSNFANEGSTTDTLINGLPDVYMANTKDVSTGKQWNTMSPAEIFASAVNTGQVVWTGPEVTAQAPSSLAPGVQGIAFSGTLQRDVTELGIAEFGPRATASNFAGEVVFVNDGVGAPPPSTGAPSTSDGCEPFAGVAGKVALIDRGTCGFAVKTKNAQNAGATAVIIANNLGRGEQDMSGTDPSITIPTLLVSNANADRIRAGLPGVSAQYFLDLTRLAGTTRDPGTGNTYVRLYAPSVFAGGSSISHFDTAARPNLLMEPFISADLKSATNLDLTPALMQDVGWVVRPGSGDVTIWGCNTGVPKASDAGMQLSSAVTSCAANASNNGLFQSCVVHATNSLAAAGYLSVTQTGRVASCAAGN
jgi:PA domain